jgi:hypothetical protein
MSVAIALHPDIRAEVRLAPFAEWNTFIATSARPKPNCLSMMARNFVRSAC